MSLAQDFDFTGRRILLTGAANGFGAAMAALFHAAGARLVLATTRAAIAHLDFAFSADDVILLGRESAGVPDLVHASADARIVVLTPFFLEKTEVPVRRLRPTAAVRAAWLR